MTWVLSSIFEEFPDAFYFHPALKSTMPSSRWSIALYLLLHLCLYTCLYLHVKMNRCFLHPPSTAPSLLLLSVISFILLLSCSRHEPRAHLQPLVSFPQPDSWITSSLIIISPTNWIIPFLLSSTSSDYNFTLNVKGSRITHSRICHFGTLIISN